MTRSANLAAFGKVVDGTPFSGNISSNVVASNYYNANSSAGSSGQVLTSGGSSSNAYWSTIATTLDSVLGNGNTTTKTITVGNSVINSTAISVGNVVANTTVLAVGNAYVNTSSVRIGNSSVNLAINSTAIAISGSVGTNNQVLASNGSATYWTTAAAGATGGGTDMVFWVNNTAVTADYTIPANTNAGTFGPVTIGSNVTVTISNTSTWTIV